MARRLRFKLFVVFMAILAARVAGAADASLKIYAAASTKEIVEKIAAAFGKANGIDVEVSPGSSSKLAKQIVEGAPADIFLSADQANVDYLAKRNLIAQRRNLLGNRLVVIVPADSKLELHSLADLAGKDVKDVALAIEGVPAGEYAREALRQAGVWDKVEDKVVGGEDVRATLAFVERGAAAGIVYRTDAAGSSKVKVAFEIDSNLHRPIEYPLVLLRREPANPQAVRLYEFFGSAEASAIIRAGGFPLMH